MSRTIFFFLTTSFLALLGACGPDASPAAGPATAEAPSSTPEEIRLNDGQKWIVSPEVTTGIRNMRKLVDSFAAPEDPEAYQALRSALEIEFALLFPKSTGPGAANEQLRNYLTPLREEFEGLSASTLSEQKQSLTRIADQLKRYATFFSS